VPIEFPLASKRTPFGSVSDPKIVVVVRTLAGEVAYRFLVDTGADFSLAPRLLGEQAGVDWDALPRARVVGVEQGGIDARLGHLPLRLGGAELVVPCLYVDAPRVPFVLGRAGFLDRFVLTIDPVQRRIVLDDRG
jgi:predicted aspartyl protease